jgi:hypothetical protein
MMNENSEVRELVKASELGTEAENFLGTELGKYLVQRAEAECEAAVESLKTVSPTATEEIRTLQNQIYRAESFQYWLGEAVTEGIVAFEQMQRGNE